MLNTERQLLVLSAGLNQDGLASPQTRERAEWAADLFNCLNIGSVVFAGGYPLLAPELSVGKCEARVLEDIAVANGLPVQASRREENSSSILSNVVNAAPLLEQKNTIVVVHRLQAIRAGFTARKLLHGTISVFAIDELPDRKRYLQEKMLLAMTAAVLHGLEPGDIKEAGRRVAKIEKGASAGRHIIKRTVLTDHTALGH